MTLSLPGITGLFVTMLVLSATPGPSDFAIVARSLTAGIGQAAWMIGGIVVADLIFILAAVYGLGALSASLGPWSALLTGLCAAYLLWLAYGLWHSKPQPPQTEGKTASGSSFMVGLAITLADPKAIIFYMGLLPAFIELDHIRLIDIGIIALLATVVIAGVKFAYALLAIRAGAFFKNQSARQRLNRVASVALLGTAVLLISQLRV